MPPLCPRDHWPSRPVIIGQRSAWPGEGGWAAKVHRSLKSEPDDWSWTEPVAKGRDRGVERSLNPIFMPTGRSRPRSCGYGPLPYRQGRGDRWHRQGDRESAPRFDQLRLARRRRRIGGPRLSHSGRQRHILAVMALAGFASRPPKCSRTASGHLCLAYRVGAPSGGAPHKPPDSRLPCPRTSARM
jgi:hypothetical protein